MLTNQPGKRPESSEFNHDQKTNIITDIHTKFDPKEYSTNPTKEADENNLAFDKCTLLSSQGSDAPTHPPKQDAQGNLIIVSGRSETAE
ncbi:hypothetical protein [Microbacterium soli]|uniref:hypothetical protein n=1 Tax=Microbacterium soli TaxID=446075 RepID=UPI0031DF30D4